MSDLAVLLSGRGSNFLAIHEAIEQEKLDARIAVVVSNRPEAPGLSKAVERGLTSHAIDHRKFESRERHEEAVIEAITRSGAEWVVLAGYMRIIGAEFVERFRNRIVNIHPSLLPSFPGLDAQKQAFEHGVEISGATVHLVDEGLDAGPIVAQRAVSVRGARSGDEVAARILPVEHELYPEAIQRLLTREWRVEGRRILWSA